MTSVNKRHSKLITNKEDVEFLLNLTENDINSYSLIMDLFGEFNGKRRFNTYDLIEIPPNTYGKEGHKNKNKFTTTVGKWIFNKYFIEPRLFDIFHYINTPIGKKQFGKINEKMSYAVLEEKCSIDDLKDFILKCQQFQPYSTVLSSSYSLNMLLITKQIDKRKKELFKKYEKEIANQDLVVIDNIQKELLDYAKELLKDDPAMDMFESGARGSFDNNFKNMFVMRGAVKDPDPNKGYNVISSNFIDGIGKDEYSALANSLAEGPYSRAKKTESGGYNEKLVLNSYQHIKLDKPGSDCGTKRYIEIDVTEDNIKEIMYCYTIVGSNLVEITSDNMNNFIGKKIKLRFASMCESKTGFCNKCAGNLFYKLGITNIGTAMPQLMSRIKVLQMKGFHDAQVKLTEMNPMKAFGIEE